MDLKKALSFVAAYKVLELGVFCFRSSNPLDAVFSVQDTPASIVLYMPVLVMAIKVLLLLGSIMISITSFPVNDVWVKVVPPLVDFITPFPA